MDVANILIGSVLKGIAEQIDMSFSQGHPVVLGQHAPVSELIKANVQRWRKTLAIELSYGIENHQINCDLLLLFTEDSLKTLSYKVAFLLEE
jgi:chemotaxis protein CheY-P-specific phosphatase CheC